MWYCEINFSSGKQMDIPFRNEEEANSFYKNLNNWESNVIFIECGYEKRKINIKNIEVVSMPKKMEDVWSKKDSEQ